MARQRSIHGWQKDDLNKSCKADSRPHANRVRRKGDCLFPLCSSHLQLSYSFSVYLLTYLPITHLLHLSNYLSTYLSSTVSIYLPTCHLLFLSPYLSSHLLLYLLFIYLSVLGCVCVCVWNGSVGGALHLSSKLVKAKERRTMFTSKFLGDNHKIMWENLTKPLPRKWCVCEWKRGTWITWTTV